MGPAVGSEEYEQQAKQVCAFLRNIEAATREDEDEIIALFASDASYSRSAIMDGLGRWRTERRSK